MFKRSTIAYGSTPQPETPYQRAGQVWEERIGSARVQARNWRLACFAALALSGGLAGGLVWESARGTVTPWVVEVDRLGEARAIAPAERGYHPTDAQIAWHLARFIEEVRGIPADPIVLRRQWLEAYHYVTDKGALALNDYARVNDPFAKIGGVQVSVQISSVVRASPSSFRVAWVELATWTARSPPPSAGAPFSPSSSSRPPTPSGSSSTRSASTSTPSPGRRNFSHEPHPRRCGTRHHAGSRRTRFPGLVGTGRAGY